MIPIWWYSRNINVKNYDSFWSYDNYKYSPRINLNDSALAEEMGNTTAGIQ